MVINQDDQEKREISEQLVVQARDLFRPYGIPIDEYDAETEWETDGSSCYQITFHRGLSISLMATNVFHDEKGKLLQCELSF